MYGPLATVTRTGYTFDGWWTATNGAGLQVLSNTTVTAVSNQTLYAKWLANAYTVTFNAQGGTSPNPTTMVLTNGSVCGTLPTTTRSGYTFDGWWTGTDRTGTQISSGMTVSNIGSNNTPLYAYWFISLGEALDNTNLVWTLGGAVRYFFGQTVTTYDGVDAVEGGGLFAGSSSTIETTVTGPGTLSFWWKKESTVYTTDWYLSVDGVYQFSCASTNFQQKSIVLTNGIHTLRWYYCGYSVYGVHVWLDQVVWTPPSALQDSDGDGIPDAWEQQHFGGATNANPNAVASNRINTLLQAYIAGLDPTNSQSALRVSGPNNNVIGWNTTASGRVYSVYWTTNLMNGFQCLESNIPWTRTSLTNQVAVPRGYFKVNVQLQQ